MNNRIYDAFDTVKADDSLKTSTKQFLTEKRNKKAFAPSTRKLILATCTMFVLLIVIGGYYGLSHSKVSYISIDVNPSIELALNRWDKVVSTTAYNDDGSLIIDNVSVKGMLYTDAINTIVESDTMQQYLTEESALTFTVACDNSQKESEIQDKIKNNSECKNYGGHCYNAETSTLHEAHESGLSFGKYSAYSILAKYDSTITVDDCKEMTMSEILKLIRSYEDTADDTTHTNGNSENITKGNGNHGHGKYNKKEECD